MELILWRHAQAENPRFEVNDHERKLTAKGRAQAKVMAQWLRKYLPPQTRIICSPAIRTRQTADALQLPIEIIDGIAPGASALSLLKATGWPEAPYPVLLIGHQPTLGQVASTLVTGKRMEWSIKKGAIWWLSQIEQTPHANITTVISPRLL